MTARPVVRCLVARLSANGSPFDIELVDLDKAADLLCQGYVIVGPDVDDMIAFERWVKEASASMPHDPGDTDG